jgi:hypothetical protein
MSTKLNKDEMKVIILINPEVFNMSFVGIGFQDECDDYLLVAFKKREVVFQKCYKTLGWAKRAFERMFSKSSDTKPEWMPSVFSYSFIDKKRRVELEGKNG